MGGAPENAPGADSTDAPRKRPAAARAYVWCVVAAAVAASACFGLFHGFSPGRAALAAGLVLTALCAAERLWPVSFGVGRASFEFGGVPIFAALILGGPACALLASVPSAAYRDPSRAAFQGAVHALQIVAGSLAFALFVPAPLLMGPQFSAPFAWGALAAGAAFFGLDALIGPFLMRLKYGLRWREVLDELVLPALPSDALAVGAALATALAASRLGPASGLVLLCGAALSLAATNLVREQRKRSMRLAAEKDALAEALRSSHAELVARLVEGLGRRDGRAAAHAAVYARDVAEEMGLCGERSEEVRLAALLMDVGLLWVPDEVLLTRFDRLNSLGRARLERHPEGGEAVLSAVPGLAEAARWVRWHHERPDGRGYPDRLKGPWIPPEAKILAAAQAYADLVLGGPSRPGLSPAEARGRLVEGMGAEFDGATVRAFLRILDAESEGYKVADDHRFVFPFPGSAQARPAAASTESGRA